MEKFRSLGLSEATLQAIAKKGYSEPTPIQAATIPLLLQGNVDVIGQAQTGTGKTAAFCIPIIEIIEPASYVQALILTPTRELALQISREIETLKGEKPLRVATVYGGVSIERQLQELQCGVDIVVGTPGRIIDFLERDVLKLDKISFFVLDEADEMLNMGFIEDVERILENTPKEKRMLFFSATMPERIMSLAKSFMRNIEIVQIEKKQITAPTVKQIYYQIAKSEKIDAIARIIDANEEFYGMIFTRTKSDADEVASQLIERGYHADALHGDISQSLREKILEKFKKRRINILVATDVAARGIDINNLTHVINYSLPEDPEAYVHRIGRTGRAGKEGIAISLVTRTDMKKLNTIEKIAKTKIQLEKLPTGKEIVETKRKKLIEKLLSNAQRSSYLPIYNEIAQQLIQTDVAPHVIIATLLHQLYGKALDEKSYTALSDHSTDKKRSSSGRVRLFVALGKKDGYSARRLVNFFEDETHTPSRLIDDVAVMENYSFITVPESEAEKILKHFKKHSKGERPLVERSQEKIKKENSVNSRLETSKHSKAKATDKFQVSKEFHKRNSKSQRTIEKYIPLEMDDFKY
ncbi:MAG: DEAD/DEAH box helicase [Cytophagales bacterium]|nr:DEAD/DEAH box helicase [Cytophagales bacterium]MDW8383591.1 DEAD/DEAH box helicase [Flammeovirgaceae bacterium]